MLNTVCAPTCIWDQSCENTCKRCKPRWLCAHAEITKGPGPTGIASCCNVDAILVYGCHINVQGTSYSGWGGAVLCSDNSAQVGILVYLTRISGLCCTVVQQTYPIDPSNYNIFSGVLPAGMSISCTDPNGNVFAIAIDTADMVENPVAGERCSPCVCAIAMPKRYSIHIDGPPSTTRIYLEDQYSAATCPCSVTGVFVYDCLHRVWVGPTLRCGNHEFEFLLELMRGSSGICGIRFIILFDGYEIHNVIIKFETSLNRRKFAGTLCAGDQEYTLGRPELTKCEMIIESEPDEDGMTHPIAVPCPDPPPQVYSTFLIGPSDDGSPRNPIVLYTDADGGNYSISLAQQVCRPTNGIIVPCCVCAAIPRTLVLTVHALCPALDGIEVTFTYGPCLNGYTWYARTPSHYTGGGSPLQEFVYWQIRCAGTESQPNAWRVSCYYYNTLGTAIITSPGDQYYSDSQSCEPFHLHFSLTSTIDFFPYTPCIVDGHLDGNMTFDVVAG